MRTARVTLLAALAVCLLASCGSRLPDDALARIDAAQEGRASGSDGRSGDAGSDFAAGSGTSGGSRSAGGSSGRAGSGGSSGSRGSSGASGGPGGTTGSASSGPGAALPGQPGGGGQGPGGAVAGSCRGGDTDTGVSAGEIKVASIVTDSGPLPGATAGAYRGAASYFAKVNSEGGVCGRRITLTKGDDGLDASRARSEFERLEPKAFAFVGSFSVADSGFIDLIEQRKVPYIATVVDPAGRDLPTALPKTEVGVVHSGPFAHYRKKYPSADKVGFLYTDVGGVRANAPLGRAALEAEGFEIVYDSAVQPTAPDFTSEVINMQREGVEFVYLYAFEINMQVRLARNMRQQGFNPPVKVNLIGYNSKLTELLGSAANGWQSHITYLPMLNDGEAAKSPGLADFMSWNQRTFPGGQLDLFTISGWRDAAMFVQALRQLGPDITQAKLVDYISNKMTSFDAAGVLPRTNPVEGRVTPCFVAVRIENGKWVREHPRSAFECNIGKRVKVD